MNLWVCGVPGCDNRAVGLGGAIGLRSIGWHFVPGGRLSCPVHRPDPEPCREDGRAGTPPCSMCTGEMEANRLQVLIRTTLEVGGTAGLIHVLHHGRSLCGMEGPPAEWPHGDRWVPLASWTEATCQRCKLNTTPEQAARLPNEQGKAT